MKLTLVHSLILAGLAASLGTAQAQTAPAPAAPAAEVASPLSFNIGVVTDYRFRGISQSRRKPALQGGIDYAADNGLYLGFWFSTIKILRDIPGGKGPVELDFYGGYKGKASDTVSYDIGVLRYQYPKENFNPTVNTTELYGAVTVGPATVKYSHSVGKETFGIGNSRGSGYLEAAATFDLGNGFSLTPHVGHQRFRNNGFASYTDYSLAVAKDLGNGLSVSATAVGTNADKTFYSSPVNGRTLGTSSLVLGVKYAF